MSAAQMLSAAIFIVIGIPFIWVLCVMLADDESEESSNEPAKPTADFYYTTRRVTALTEEGKV